MPDNFIRLDGAFELRRAFSRLSSDLGDGVKEALGNSAESIRSDGSTLVRQQVSGMARSKLPWWKLRVGVTANTVYIAPEQRGIKSGRINDRKRRPKLRTRSDYVPAMEQALERNEDEVVGSVERELDDLLRAWSRI